MASSSDSTSTSTSTSTGTDINTRTRKQHVLVIRCSHTQRSTEQDPRSCISVDPIILVPSPIDMRSTSTAFLASKWRCGLTRSWLFEGQIHISLGMLDSSIEHSLPAFEFIHCIPLNPANEADPKVFRASEHDGSRRPHGSKPFMKGGDCRCKYTLPLSLPIVLLRWARATYRFPTRFPAFLTI